MLLAFGEGALKQNLLDYDQLKRNTIIHWKRKKSIIYLLIQEWEIKLLV